MDDMTNLYAMLSAQKFLLGQLYAHMFLASPDQRQNVPKALIASAQNKSYTKAQADTESLIEMQARVVLELRSFFADVEKRVQEAQARRGQ